MKDIKQHPVTVSLRYLVSWTLFALLTGAAGGLIGGAFGWLIKTVTGLRDGCPWIVFILPAVGVLTALLYEKTGERDNKGTDMIIAAASAGGEISKPTGPLIFVSTVIAHMGGASVGREGAALQLGGWLGARLSELLRLDEEKVRTAVMCGMSAVFSALFGTPVTAAVFCIEVVSVGSFYYSALVPCIFSAFIGTGVSRLLGAHPEQWTLPQVPEMTPAGLLLTVLLGLLCALLAIVLTEVLHGAGKTAKKLIPNAYIRAAAAGLVIAALTWALGTLKYTGSGTVIIDEAIEGGTDPFAFVLKLAFTALAIAGGFKGGEIVPTLSIGAAFGALFASLTGLPVPLMAACGMIALFAGATNCPIASLLMAMEMFHGQGLPYFAITVTLAFVLSGYYSLYSTQSFFCSKLKMERMDGGK